MPHVTHLAEPLHRAEEQVQVRHDVHGDLAGVHDHDFLDLYVAICAPQRKRDNLLARAPRVQPHLQECLHGHQMQDAGSGLVGQHQHVATASQGGGIQRGCIHHGDEDTHVVSVPDDGAHVGGKCGCCCCCALGGVTLCGVTVPAASTAVQGRKRTRRMTRGADARHVRVTATCCAIITVAASHDAVRPCQLTCRKHDGAANLDQRARAAAQVGNRWRPQEARKRGGSHALVHAHLRGHDPVGGLAAGLVENGEEACSTGCMAHGDAWSERGGGTMTACGQELGSAVVAQLLPHPRL
jgi:hypothetical protein